MTTSHQRAIAFTFPGQGSQSVGMLADFATEPCVLNTFAEASEAIGFDLWVLMSAGSEQKLNQTQYTQPVLLTASIALWRLWQEAGGVTPGNMAGHSLGEYSALVAAGAIALQDAVRFVHRRGELMQGAVPEGEGAMAAVLGLDEDAVTTACAKVSDGIVAPANLNAPGQVVIAGHRHALEAAQAHCNAAGAKKIIPLAVSVPAHCALMQVTLVELAAELDALDIQQPTIDVIHNFDVSISDSVKGIKDRLLKQMTAPVRWRETIEALHNQQTIMLIECGPGAVLSGLARRINKSLNAFSLATASAFGRAIEAAGCYG